MQNDTLSVTVLTIEPLTPAIKRYTLAASDGGALPAFSGGSHILVHMEIGGRRVSNAYSLTGAPAQTRHYQIAVQLEQPSKGGSAWMHQQLRVGDTLAISPPNNLFALAGNARKHVLIAGGIGITPFIAQMEELRARQAEYELHYAVRSPQHGAFAAELADGPHRSHVRLYARSLGQRLDIDAVLAACEAHTHVYVCGPRRMNEAALAAAARHGVPASNLHLEQFAAPEVAGRSFTVRLAKSGTELVVDEGTTILSAIEKSGAADVPFLCRSGVCGSCETTIVEGQAEHLDQYLTPEEKAANKTMMVCVSRASCARLVLDL